MCGFASNAVIPAVSKNGIVRDLTADDNIAVEITDLLRAKTIEPLRNFIAEKNVAFVGQFVAGPTEQSFRLTRMFIWCCAADPCYSRSFRARWRSGFAVGYRQAAVFVR